MKLSETNFAKIVSIIFNPFLVLTLALVLGNLIWVQLHTGPVIFVISVLIFLPFIVYTAKISTKKAGFWHPHNLLRKERDSVYIFGMFASLISILAFSYIGINYWLGNSFIAFLLIALLFLVNKYIDKASVHTAVFCFSVFYLTDKFDTSIGLFLIALPIIMWARVKLHQHTWVQLFLGIIVGMLVGLLSWTI